MSPSIPFPFGVLLNKKAARVEVNISLAFLHWVGIAIHPWPFVSDIAIFVLKGDVKLQLTSVKEKEWKESSMFSMCRLTSLLQMLSCKQHLAATSLWVLLIRLVVLSRWTQIRNNTMRSQQNSLTSCIPVYVPTLLLSIIIQNCNLLQLNDEILKVILCHYILMRIPCYACCYYCIIIIITRQGDFRQRRPVPYKLRYN